MDPGFGAIVAFAPIGDNLLAKVDWHDGEKRRAFWSAV